MFACSGIPIVGLFCGQRLGAKASRLCASRNCDYQFGDIGHDYSVDESVRTCLVKMAG